MTPQIKTFKSAGQRPELLAWRAAAWSGWEGSEKIFTAEAAVWQCVQLQSPRVCTSYLQARLSPYLLAHSKSADSVPGNRKRWTANCKGCLHINIHYKNYSGTDVTRCLDVLQFKQCGNGESICLYVILKIKNTQFLQYYMVEVFQSNTFYIITKQRSPFLWGLRLPAC